MTTFIVDFQAFKSLNNKFILKELAIVSLDQDIIVHTFIKPPVEYDYLYPELQDRVDYLT